MRNGGYLIKLSNGVQRKCKSKARGTVHTRQVKLNAFVGKYREVVILGCFIK